MSTAENGLNPETLIAPFEPRLNWERREIHAHTVRGDGGEWASRLISAVLQDVGMKTARRDGSIFAVPDKIRKPDRWLCTRMDGERSAEISMLLCAARALMAETPEMTAGIAFLTAEADPPLPCVLLTVSADLPAGQIGCRGAGEELKAALSRCPAEMRFGGEKAEQVTVTVGTGNTKHFERDLTILPAGAAALVIPALLPAENRG